MTRNMSRTIGIAVMAFTSIGASAHAQTWSSIPMPTIDGWGGTVLNTVAPYALGFPPCQNGCNSHYLSASQTSVKGFRFRGNATVLGSGGTSWANLQAAFFTTSPTFTGSEYGLFVPYPSGNQMYLYQCVNCNTAGQNWTQTLVWSAPGEYYDYEVVVNSDGSYTVNVVSTVSPYTIVATTNVPRASWQTTSLYDVSGYLTIVAQHDAEDGGNYSESAFHVDEIDILQ
jgi:hypothetical protein